MVVGGETNTSNDQSGIASSVIVEIPLVFSQAEREPGREAKFQIAGTV